MSKNDPARPAAEDAERRSFLVKVSAVICGGLITLFPFAAGFGVAVDPWWRRRSAAPAEGAPSTTDSSDLKFVPICPLESLQVGGAPQTFPVITDVDDGWTHALNQRIGMVYLERHKSGDPQVTAFSASCPHLGCFVDYIAAKKCFECPCHKSAFSTDGAKMYGPSRRGMDQLTVRIDGTGEAAMVSVAFQKFQAGIEDRKPA